MPTRRWQRRIVGILTLGGAFAGIAMNLGLLIGGQVQGVGIAVLIVITGVFIWGVICGVLLIEQSPRSSIFAIPFWAIQIPAIHLPAIAYDLSTGARFYLQLYATNGTFSFTFNAGIGTTFNLVSGVQHWLFGVNILAIIVVVWLARSWHAAT